MISNPVYELVIDEVESNEMDRGWPFSADRGERARGLSPEVHHTELRLMELRRAELLSTPNNDPMLAQGTSAIAPWEWTPENRYADWVPPANWNWESGSSYVSTPTHVPIGLAEEIVPWQLPQQFDDGVSMSTPVKHASDVCIGCLCTQEEVNIIFGPCGCNCVNYCTDCVNDGIEEKLADMFDWKKSVDYDKILGSFPHCACCKAEYMRLVRRSRRTKRSNPRFF
uniref:Uncharacterized protein n=1 Tax=Meloidogyne javanica TaxID=6303 RepID=A0A915M0C3_MELJA